MAGCGGAGGLWYDYRRNSMEAEPGRCRRTDGKKWRCSKDVVPDQKYCERHMHRGRLRSRKPVETPSSSTAIATPTTTFNNTHLSISIPTGLQLMTSSSASTATTMNNNNNNNNSGSSSRFGFSPTSVLQTGSTAQVPLVQNSTTAPGKSTTYEGQRPSTPGPPGSPTGSI
ncbi:Growth-regulating factor 12 [Acorus calamus]|uniref:Growth-regulating factor n=1 Tax=Acorus calamus TaxID=4465 RepID=A0AAV9CDA0_ACOCL|nr:Growth-regulating factor 12 [Acorus calamus]